jgi:formiminoglutamate deiminase
MPSIFARSALLPEGWRADVRLSIEHGRIASVEPGVAAQAGDDRHALVLPGMPNLHSHAFQRGMAGLAETRGPGADSFWSWREVMYRHALSLTPRQVEAIAAQLYVEMLEAGFTRVGEFHYLHHAPDGRAYDDPAEMAARICAASAEAGIGLTLLPVMYARSGFGGAAPAPQQRRFVNSPDGFARLLEAAEAHAAALAHAVVGVAPHSLRAVTPQELGFAVGLRPTRPLHIHVAEQVKEVEDCLAWSGLRPVEWLLEHQPVDARWCLIHATQMTSAETQALATSRAVAGLCPVTEANLGDGIFDGAAFLAAGGAFGVGSDSNVLIGVGDELRQLEYSQRLRDKARNVLATSGVSTGRRLFEGAAAGGARALGQDLSGLAIGAPADIMALDTDDPALAGRAGDAALDAWIFASRRGADTVWVGGHKRVTGGVHVARDVVAKRFRHAMATLM